MIDKTYTSSSEFLDLFYDPSIDSYSLATKSKLSLYVLRIDGGKFDYESMHKVLGNASMAYVLSRSAFKDAISGAAETMNESVRYVQGRFRDAGVNDGEGGELMLYCFLESHLGAPKILSKMELKTAENDYIKGADGIHLLDTGGGNFQLIFGESKMISDSTEKGSSFRKAIADAISSVKKVERQGTSAEIKLIDSNLMKETFNDATLKQIKSIILPSARSQGVTKQNAFGIFIGFEIDVTDWKMASMSSQEIDEKIKDDVHKLVESRYDYINKKIAENNLEGYHFYIYAVPFIKSREVNIDITRKEIVGRI